MGKTYQRAARRQLILNGLVAILFILFAYWQFNDPDSWRWILLYLAVATVAGLAAFRHYSGWLTWAALALAGAWMLWLLPDFIRWLGMGAPSIVESMKAEKDYIELTREFLGLLICVITLGLYARWGYRSRPRPVDGKM